MPAPILRTDERTEAIRALEKTHRELQTVVSDPYNWKWVLISLHNAVQAYMVVILRGTNNSMVARAKESVLKAYNEGDAKALANADYKALVNYSDDSRTAIL